MLVAVSSVKLRLRGIEETSFSPDLEEVGEVVELVGLVGLVGLLGLLVPLRTTDDAVRDFVEEGAAVDWFDGLENAARAFNAASESADISAEGSAGRTVVRSTCSVS